MGDLGSIWLYHEVAGFIASDDEDLKQKLQSTRLELQAVKLEASAAKEQTRQKEKQLHNLLIVACKERDEAREQLHNLLNKINPTQNLSPVDQPCLMMISSNNNVPNSDESNIFFKQQQQQLQYPVANSCITESNTLSDPFNTNSYVSSPVDTVTSPEFSTLNNMGESGSNVGHVNRRQTFVQDMGQTHLIWSVFDHTTAVIDELAKGKILPQKGKLLDAVMEAGPLLQTLMLAGPLPRWRNPPPLQPFKIPQVTGSDYPILDPVRPPWSNNTPFAEMSCGSSSHMGTNSMLNFSIGSGSIPSLISPAMMMMNMNMNNQFAAGKRQRLM